MALTSRSSFPLGVAVDLFSEYMGVWQVISQTKLGLCLPEEGEDRISVYFNDLSKVLPLINRILNKLASNTGIITTESLDLSTEIMESKLPYRSLSRAHVTTGLGHQKSYFISFLTIRHIMGSSSHKILHPDFICPV